MLDENLPAFFLKASDSGIKHLRDIYSTHLGSDPAPAYTVHNLDPASPSPAHKNCYGAALFDAFYTDICYGEVLARPAWTQPTLSAEELRKNNGVPPPPQPILPTEVVIQLYNPDQQVKLEVKEGKWGSSDTYEFSVPQSTFRTPSASNLDRGQSDPALQTHTPKINLVWKRESKLSKDLTCFVTGRSTDTLLKKRSMRKDPDIAIALWRNVRELTVYEPNIQRLELEDPKGLEVVLLLSAIVLKDLYFSNKDHLRETFNVSELPGQRRKLSGGGRKLSNPQQTHTASQNPLTQAPAHSQSPLVVSNNESRQPLPKIETLPPQPYSAPPPVADPRSQWQIDAETARLRAQAEAEAQAAKRARREREKTDELEAKRLQKMVEEEDRVRRQKQAKVDKETERLRKQFGVEPISDAKFRPANTSNTQRGASPSAMLMSGANPNASSLSIPGLGPGGVARKKKSFFGLRSASDDAEDPRKLTKKASAMW